MQKNKTKKEILSEIEEIEKKQLKVGIEYRAKIKALDQMRIALIDTVGEECYSASCTDWRIVPVDEFEDMED
jgi:hypothetical protein